MTKKDTFYGLPAIPREEWPEFLADVIKLVLETWEELGAEDQVPPAIFARTAEGRRVILDVRHLMSSPVGKRAIEVLMVGSVRAGAKELATAWEVWGVRGRAGEEMPDCLEDHPNREELLMVQYFTQGRELHCVAPITHSEGCRHLGEFRAHEMRMTGGRFSNVFLKAQATQRDKN